MPKLQAIGTKVVIRRDESKTHVGRILLPDTAKEKRDTGVVVSVGTGRTLETGVVEPIPVAVGDTVLFGKWNGSDVEVDGESFLVVDAENILCKVVDG